MLLIKIRNRKNTRGVVKNPFLFRLKPSSFPKVKRGIKSLETSLTLKKLGLLELPISSRKTSYSLLSDGSTKFTLRLGTSEIAPKSNLSLYDHPHLIDYKKSYFSRSLNYLSSPDSVGRLFFSLFDPAKNKLIYGGSFGCFISVLSVSINKGFVKVLLPSGEHKKLPVGTLGRSGRACGIFKKYSFLGKYKESHRGKTVRGVAMNPVDHHNGGRSNIKKPFLNRYNRVAKFGK